jgi:hypothetical protein
MQNRVTARSLLPVLTVDSCASFVKHALAQCTQNHPECGSISAGKIPLRLLEISGPSSVHIVSTEDLIPVWTALSYCWGPVQDVLTASKADIGLLMQGFNITLLPGTLQDAVSVVRALGFQYICL